MLPGRLDGGERRLDKCHFFVIRLLPGISPSTPAPDASLNKPQYVIAGELGGLPATETPRAHNNTQGVPGGSWGEDATVRRCIWQGMGTARR